MKVKQNNNLEELHKNLYDLLVAFDVFCNRHNLKYSLTSGTLIGAIRENGFIPWDDDIDIMMPREDYEKFVKISLDELNNNEKSHYKIEEHRLDDNYTLFFAEFIDVSKKYNIDLYDANHPRKYYGIRLDVFPFDYINPSKIFKFFYNFYIRTITSCYSYKSYNKESLIRSIKILFSNMFSKKCLEKSYNRLVSKGLRRKEEGKKYDICCFTFFRKNSLKLFYFDSDLFDKMTLHKFENGEFPIIAKYDTFLTKIFGDYMTPPKEKMQKPKHIEEKK